MAAMEAALSVMGAINKREARTKGKLVGQKRPLKPKGIGAFRIHLQNELAVSDRALFNLSIDSKLRGCSHAGRVCATSPTETRLSPGHT